jgi:hypothetical protein
VSKDQRITISVFHESPVFLPFIELRLLDPEHTQSEMSCSRISYYDFLEFGKGEGKKRADFTFLTFFVGTGAA